MVEDVTETDLGDDTSENLEMVDLLSRDYLARYRNGERPSVEEYATRHPDLANQIERMFPLVASIEKVKVGEQHSKNGSATLAGRLFERMGDFRIIREIGRGGMGIVFEAEQESLNRRVAIKVLPRQSLLDEHALYRFQRESKTAAAMHHTNIVPIFGTGESDGSHYLVMQLVAGEALDRILDNEKRKFSYREVSKIGSQVADAVAYAHENGVLHRDIKPANILIEKDGTPQVTDFGLATNIDEDRTLSGTLSGTLRYMAPERFRGVSEPSIDVYSIGLTLYEMLTGRPAFEHSSTNELLAIVAKPPARSIRSVRPDVPIDLETIVLKAMKPEPADRYQSAAALRDDLRRYLKDEPIQARRTHYLHRLIRWCRREPKMAIAIFVTLAALLIGTIISSAAYLSASAANERTTVALGRSEEIVNLAVDALDKVVDKVALSSVGDEMRFDDAAGLDIEGPLPDPSIRSSPHSAVILETLRPLYHGLSEQAPNRPDVLRQMADAGLQHARILDQLGKTEQSISIIKLGISAIQNRSDKAQIPEEERHLRLARLYNELGNYYSSEYQFAEADQAFEKSVGEATTISDSEPFGQYELARSYISLGDLLPQRRKMKLGAAYKKRSQEHLNTALKILNRLSENQPSQLKMGAIDILKSRAHQGLAWLAWTPEIRAEHAHTAVAILQERLIESPDSTSVRFELVMALSDVDPRLKMPLDQLQRANKRLSQALSELLPLRSGYPENPVFAVRDVHLHHKMAHILKQLEEFDQAEEYVVSAIAIQESIVQQYPDNVSYQCWHSLLYRTLAEIKFLDGKCDDAHAALDTAQSIVDSVPPESAENPLVIRVRQLNQQSVSKHSE